MQSVTRFSPERQVGETPTERFPLLDVDRTSRRLLAARVRQIVRFASDALLDMASGNPLDATHLAVVESCLLDALDALRAIRAPESDRPF